MVVRVKKNRKRSVNKRSKRTSKRRTSRNVKRISRRKSKRRLQKKRRSRKLSYKKKRRSRKRRSSKKKTKIHKLKGGFSLNTEKSLRFTEALFKAMIPYEKISKEIQEKVKNIFDFNKFLKIIKKAGHKLTFREKDKDTVTKQVTQIIYAYVKVLRKINQHGGSGEEPVEEEINWKETEYLDDTETNSAVVTYLEQITETIPGETLVGRGVTVTGVALLCFHVYRVYIVLGIVNAALHRTIILPGVGAGVYMPREDIPSGSPSPDSRDLVIVDGTGIAVINVENIELTLGVGNTMNVFDVLTNPTSALQRIITVYQQNTQRLVGQAIERALPTEQQIRAAAERVLVQEGPVDDNTEVEYRSQFRRLSQAYQVMNPGPTSAMLFTKAQMEARHYFENTRAIVEGHVRGIRQNLERQIVNFSSDTAQAIGMLSNSGFWILTSGLLIVYRIIQILFSRPRGRVVRMGGRWVSADTLRDDGSLIKDR